MKTLKLVLAALAFLSLTACSTLSDQAKVGNIHKNYIGQHQYVKDNTQYGVSEKWTPSLVGDCEDYALFIYKKAKKLGVSTSVWIVRTETNEPHVVVVVGDKYVVDNRFNYVVAKADVQYKWIIAVPQATLEKY
jgi:predicted transglutaminase-like cysteine proteinase